MSAAKPLNRQSEIAANSSVGPSLERINIYDAVSAPESSGVAQAVPIDSAMANEQERIVRVLVIDDDFDIQALLTLILSRAGFDVRTVDNGKEALRWMNEIQPDIVLLDVMMPEMDGWETCRRIRSKSQIPIIFLTVRGRRSDIARGMRLGANDYVSKPFIPSDLVARVRQLTADVVH